MNYGSAVKGVVENHIKNMDALDNEARKIEEQLKQERITGRTAAEKRHSRITANAPLGRAGSITRCKLRFSWTENILTRL